MVFMHNLYEEVPALTRLLNLFSTMKMVAEMKVEGQWVSMPEWTRLNLMLQSDDEHADNFLMRCADDYLVHGAVYIYKTKTRKCLLDHLDKPIYESVNYKDGYVAGLEILDPEVTGIQQTEEQKKAGQAGNLITEIHDRGMTLSRAEYTFAMDWSPSSNPLRISMSVGKMLDRAVHGLQGYSEGDISSILGISDGLVNGYETSTDDRKKMMIQSALHDVAIPLATKIMTAIERDIGLHDETRLVLDIKKDVDWIAVWEHDEREYEQSK